MSPELLAALRVLLSEHIGDKVYDIREREGKGWHGPRVKAWSDACAVIEREVKEASTVEVK